MPRVEPGARLARGLFLAALSLAVLLPGGARPAAARRPPRPGPLEEIRLSTDGSRLLRAGGSRFLVWGVNYDHDAAGRLLEDYWDAEWPTVAADFAEIRELGANTVRIHLQLGKFMRSEHESNPAALKQFARLVRLAEENRLYLDLTGLGCYHRKDVPAWYDPLSESRRWAVQARFWEAVARVGSRSPAVFCYDLMNEPIIPGTTETEWLAGAFAG